MYKFLILALLLCGCAHRPLTVQTQYFSIEDLASYIVDTPDPLLNTPPIGQRLIISWDLKNEWDWFEKFSLKLTVRYANREEITQSIDIYKKYGYYLFEVANAKYCETGGIQTYKVELIADESVVSQWKHPLWRELITIHPTDAPGVPGVDKVDCPFAANVDLHPQSSTNAPGVSFSQTVPGVD